MTARQVEEVAASISGMIARGSNAVIEIEAATPIEAATFLSQLAGALVRQSDWTN